MQRDPSARPTAAELLQHPFLAGATSEPASLRDRIIAYAASPRSVTLLEVGDCCGCTGACSLRVTLACRCSAACCRRVTAIPAIVVVHFGMYARRPAVGLPML